jgi:hypothetical protein
MPAASCGCATPGNQHYGNEMKKPIGSPTLWKYVQSRLRKFAGPATLAAVLGVSACSDATGPSQANDSDTQTVLANGPALGGLIAGESSRLIPSVTKGAASDDLSATLGELTAALQAGLGNESRAAITRFNTVMDQLATSVDNPDVAAELSALRHAVDVVREAVEAR